MNQGIEGLFKANKSIPLDQYMAWNNAVYYQKKSVLGAEGDFITAPEFTPVFGLTLGQWVVQEYQRLRIDSSVFLVEFGPGRGLLMRDMLKSVRAAGLQEKIQPVLVENSPMRQAEQRETLAHFSDFNPKYISHINELKGSFPLIGVANEFFDAFPIKQWVQRGEEVFERCVLKNDDHALEIVEEISDKSPFSEEGVHESCPAGVQYFQLIMDKIFKNRGSFLMIDYGDWEGVGDTLQALKSHQKVQLFQEPGQVDLTAHVRFSEYAAHVPAAFQKSFHTQGDFLRKLAVEALFELLWMQDVHMKKQAFLTSKTALLEAKNALLRVKKRLLGPEKSDMGSLFKVLEIRS